MRSAKELHGIAIVDVANGKKLGRVEEVVVSPDDRRLLGFVMHEGNFLNRSECVVEIDDVRSIGHDAITVEGEDVMHTPEAVAEAIREARTGGRQLVGRKVVTQDGSVVGTVADYRIDEAARRVSALDVGGGIFEKGDTVPADWIVSVGPDVVIVRDRRGQAGERESTFAAAAPGHDGGASRDERDIRP